MASEFLSFEDCAQEVRRKINPEKTPETRYIGLEHIEQGSLHLNGYGTTKDISSTKSAFTKGEILFGKLRPYFRKVVRAPFDGVCSTDIWVVRANDGIDQGFLYYWMASEDFINFSMQGSEGARMPRAKWEYVSRHRIPFFDLNEQRAIAHILGSLDDKIELNRRMNETLEAMAQAMFKSWFVDFDPVIDNALAAGNPIPDELKERAALRASLGDARKPLPDNVRKLFPSEFEHTNKMGWIPKGWKEKTIGDLMELAYGKALASRVREPGPYPVYGSGGIAGYHKQPMVNGPGIIVGRKGTVGSVYRENRGFFPIDTVFYVKLKKDLPLYWVYQNLLHMDIGGLGADSAVPGVNRNTIYAQMWVFPGPEVLSSYWLQLQTYIQKYDHLLEQNLSLQIARDTLLPKLLSGEVRISKAKELMEEYL